jgi:hypothetical protein
MSFTASGSTSGSNHTVMRNSAFTASGSTSGTNHIVMGNSSSVTGIGAIAIVSSSSYSYYNDPYLHGYGYGGRIYNNGNTELYKCETKTVRKDPKTSIPDFQLVFDHVVSLLPSFFPMDIRKLIATTYLEQMVNTPCSEEQCVIVGSKSSTVGCSNITMIGSNIIAIGCHDCVFIHASGTKKIYIGYKNKIMITDGSMALPQLEK